MNGKNQPITIGALFSAGWKSKWILLGFGVLGVIVGGGLAQIQKPVYRVEYTITAPQSSALGAFQAPFLKLEALQFGPTSVAIPRQGAHDDDVLYLAPTIDVVFSYYIRKLRSLKGLESALEDPRIINVAHVLGLSKAELRRQISEVESGVRFVNLGQNFERTRIVLLGEYPELLEALGLVSLEKTSGLMWDDLYVRLEERIRSLEPSILYRQKYLARLRERKADELYYSAARDVEEQMLEDELRSAKNLLVQRETVPLYSVADGGLATRVLLRPKPGLYKILGAGFGILVGFWIALLIDALPWLRLRRIWLVQAPQG